MIIYDYFHDYSKNKISQSERKAQSQDCIELLMLLYTGSVMHFRKHCFKAGLI